VGTVGHSQYSMPGQYRQEELYIVKSNTCETPSPQHLPAFYTIWCRISDEPSMPASVEWKWRVEESQPETGSSMSKSSPPEASDE
jgi:hypothetical protein